MSVQCTYCGERVSSLQNWVNTSWERDRWLPGYGICRDCFFHEARHYDLPDEPLNYDLQESAWEDEVERRQMA